MRSSPLQSDFVLLNGSSAIPLPTQSAATDWQSGENPGQTRHCTASVAATFSITGRFSGRCTRSVNGARGIGIVVRVLIALAVFQLLHQLCRRISQVQRHGLRGLRMRVRGCCIVCGVDGVALGSSGQIDRGLRERRVAFGHADEVRRVLRRDGDRQRLWIGVADVFGRESNEPAGDVERILSGFEHAGYPVHGGIRVHGDLPPR